MRYNLPVQHMLKTQVHRYLLLILITLAAINMGACRGNNGGNVNSNTIPSLASGIIGASGGTVTYNNGSSDLVILTIPAGALDADTEITISAPDVPSTDPWLVPNTEYVFGPEGTIFNSPISITIAYDSADVPAAITDEGTLGVHKMYSDEWLESEGTTVDTTAKTATSTTTSFSRWGILKRAINSNETSITSVYPANGANWNDYVINNGTDVFNADDTACAGTEKGGYTACIHGGEKKAFIVPRQTSCNGLSATDSAHALNWVCVVDASANVVMVSTSFNEGKYLSDLIDWTSAPAWKNMSVNVYKNGIFVGASSSTPWWNNTITADPASGALTAAGTIYAISTNKTALYTLGASKVGFVVKPGVVVTGAASGDQFSSIVSGNTKNFLWVEGAFDASINGYGAFFDYVNFSVMRGVSAWGGYYDGVTLLRSHNNFVKNIKVNNNNRSTFGGGLQLANAEFNTVVDVYTGNNARGIQLAASNNILYGIYAANDLYSGIYHTVRNNNIVLNGKFSNTQTGLSVDQAKNSIFTGITAANNLSVGVDLVMSVNNKLSSSSMVNNYYGMMVRISSADNQITSSSITNNDYYGIYIQSATGTGFHGNLKIGNNVFGDCWVDIDSAGNGGLKDDAVGVDATHDGLCIQDSPSTFGTALTGTNMAASFVGKITIDDAFNASDNNAVDNLGSGMAQFDNITDWTNFANPYRGWGVDGSIFPNVDHQGNCKTGVNCRIWDLSLVNSDTVNLNVNSIPSSGTETTTHVWYMAAIPVSQANCDSLAPVGSVFNTNRCESTYLNNTHEIMGDGLGNENGLCESNETCLFTPNIGAYQGHGNLVDAGTIGIGGTIEKVILKKYEFNGY